MGIDWQKLAAAPITFTDQQIADAVKVVKALPAVNPDKDPDQLAVPWKMRDDMPTITDLDFRDVTIAPMAIAPLQASNENIGRQNLIWHVQHPDTAKNPSPLTLHAIIGTSKDGDVIIDGHHRLAALMYLGATKATVFKVPLK